MSGLVGWRGQAAKLTHLCNPGIRLALSQDKKFIELNAPAQLEGLVASSGAASQHIARARPGRPTLRWPLEQSLRQP